MNKYFVIFFLFISNIIYAQLFNCEVGGQKGKHSENVNLNLGLQFEPRLDTSGRHLLFVAGIGAEYFFDGTILFDVKLEWALSQLGCVGHIYKLKEMPKGFKRSLPALFISCHYMADEQFQQQYICPELGFNPTFFSCSKITISPSIYYYIPFNSSGAWSKNIFLFLKFGYTSWHKKK